MMRKRKKKPIGKGELVGLIRGPRKRGLETQIEALTHTGGGDYWVYMCEWKYHIEKK